MTVYKDKIPDGIHRCRILSARKTVSRAGRDCLRIVLEIYGYYDQLTHYITFLPDRPEIASRNLRELFASCPGIADNYDTHTWRGHELACQICHEEYNGERCERVARFIPAAEQAGLPHFDSAERPGEVVVFEQVVTI